MGELNDIELIREYCRNASEEAFAELVRRHIGLVHSAAMRHVRIAAHAEEITQAVFLILMRKAPTLRKDIILKSWLYETTRLTSLSFLRRERRRQHREQQAYMQSTLQSITDTSEWEQVAPLLDDAISSLAKKDRDAVVLRFFGEKNLPEVATALNISPSAAQSRVHRALEKLRRHFLKRGVATSTAVIGVVLSANAAQAAPSALTTSVTATALGNGAAASGSTVGLVKGALNVMAWTKIQLAAFVGAGVLLAAVGGTRAYQGHFFSWHKPVAVFSRNTWAFRGYGTPEATIESSIWAKSTGNLEAFFAASTPEIAREFAVLQLRNLKTDQDRSKALVASVNPISAIRIEKKTVLSDGQVILELRCDGLPQDGYELVTMTNLGGHWCSARVEAQFGEGYSRFPPLEKNEFATKTSSDLQGSWTGEIKAGKGSLHFRVNIAEASAGKFLADFYCAEGGNFRQAARVTYEGTTVTLAAFGPRNGVFQGTLSKGDKQIHGKWRQGERVIPMTFARLKS
jgi:RNA polymerase sigma factor (sigma-70 family)